MAFMTRPNSTALILSCLGPALILYAILLTYHPPSIRSSRTGSTTSADYIPNIAQYVYILPENTTELSFRFSQVLSVYATSKYWQPSAIYLHTNAPADVLSRLRSGVAGKWTQLIFQIPNLRIVRAEPPVHTTKNYTIDLVEHKSDFVRVAALREYGGVYLDFDVHPLRDIKPLRESGFRGIVGRRVGGQVCSGVFMTMPHGRLIGLWSEAMHDMFDGYWSTHSDYALSIVSQKLVAEPREALIMEREAFAPGSWMYADKTLLLQVHDEQVSALDMMDEDGHLPSYEEKDLPTRWSLGEFGNSGRQWSVDWSTSYVLHAFAHEQDSFSGIPGFESISPRYIMNRRSNMARAVCPVRGISMNRA